MNLKSLLQEQYEEDITIKEELEVETRIDEMVLQVQQWLNQTYGSYVASGRFNLVTENGKTGWNTIYGLRRALQIELGIMETSDSFGPTTYKLCPAINQGSEGNLVSIVQGGLWCKGYGPGGFNGYYGNGTYAAVKALKTDAGFPSASGNMQRDFMRALLDMSAFSCVSGGTEEIRVIQQQLNYNYYDYYQISPCDGLYNREMNKMLIYALQMELGISASAATGTWGPTTISLCKVRSFTIGNTNAIIKLIKYALVCNGFTVSTNSATYDAALELASIAFCDSLLIPKSANAINYPIIKSLLSSNGDIDRLAEGCDTATKLNIQQIQTIKNAGYTIVGRYISNTPGGTLDKALTVGEIDDIMSNGLDLFYIFQEYNAAPEAFNKIKGEEQAETAYNAAKSLGIASGNPIYFAVDCDPQATEIDTYIIPYFAAIFLKFYNLGAKYKIGVYGTRNVCLRLQESFGEDFIQLFVSDASYGFSGNLGFIMPKLWDLEQFATDITIGSGSGTVSIDKVAVKGYSRNSRYYINVDNLWDETANLKVNMSDGNLRVYKSAYADEETRVYTHMESVIGIIPKNAMFVDFNSNEDKGKIDSFHAVSYYDGGEIINGLVYVGDYNSLLPSENPYSAREEEDLLLYKGVHYFVEFTPSSNQTELIPSNKEKIGDVNCSVYSLRYDTNYYDSEGMVRGTIPKETVVAMATNTVGNRFKYLISVFRIKQNGEWISLYDKDWNLKNENIFIDYQLEKGGLPGNRLLK